MINKDDKRINITRHRRKQMGLTQQDVADMLNISRQSYLQIEAGNLSMSRDRAQRFCKALNLDWESLNTFENNFYSVLQTKGLITGSFEQKTSRYMAHDLIEDCEHLDDHSLYLKNNVNDHGINEVSKIIETIELMSSHHKRVCKDCEFVQTHEYMDSDQDGSRRIPLIETNWKAVTSFVNYMKKHVGAIEYVDDEYLQIVMFLVEAEYVRIYNKKLFGGHYKKLPDTLHVSGWKKEFRKVYKNKVVSLEELPTSAIPVIDAYIALARIRGKSQIIETLWTEHSWYGTTSEWCVPYIEYYSMKSNELMEDALEETKSNKKK